MSEPVPDVNDTGDIAATSAAMILADDALAEIRRWQSNAPISIAMVEEAAGRPIRELMSVNLITSIPAGGLTPAPPEATDVHQAITMEAAIRMLQESRLQAALPYGISTEASEALLHSIDSVESSRSLSDVLAEIPSPLREAIAAADPIFASNASFNLRLRETPALLDLSTAAPVIRELERRGMTRDGAIEFLRYWDITFVEESDEIDEPSDSSEAYDGSEPWDVYTNGDVMPDHSFSASMRSLLERMRSLPMPAATASVVLHSPVTEELELDPPAAHSMPFGTIPENFHVRGTVLQSADMPPAGRYLYCPFLPDAELVRMSEWPREFGICRGIGVHRHRVTLQFMEYIVERLDLGPDPCDILDRDPNRFLTPDDWLRLRQQVQSIRPGIVARAADFKGDIYYDFATSAVVSAPSPPAGQRVIEIPDGD